MLQDLLIPLIVVGLAELGDKTQLSVLLLASKTEKHLLLFLGTILTFFTVDGLAILAGEWIADLVPSNLLNILSGAVFIFLDPQSYSLETKRQKPRADIIWGIRFIQASS